MSWLLISLAFGAPLELEEVLSPLAERVPALLAAEQKRREAEGKLLSKRGAFDPKMKAKGGIYHDTYPRQMGEATLSANTLFGPELEAGWRLGQGDYPSYDGRKTAPGGEVFVGLKAPLLDGLVMSQARTELQIAKEGVELAGLSLADKQRLARAKAHATWAKWVATGKKLAVQEEWVKRTAARQAALNRQVEEGVRATIDQLDNLRSLRQREADRVAAAQNLAAAALSLSLWVRDADGQPVVPDPERLPLHDAPPPGTEGRKSVEDLARQRPDTTWANRTVTVAELDVRRQRNALLPDLDLTLIASQAVDGTEPVEVYAGAQLAVPLLLRKSRGEFARASAVQARREADARTFTDRARMEIATARLAVEAAWNELVAHQQAAEHAEQVALLEQRRFDLGAGDLFKLLSRETTAIKAKKSVIEAELRYRLSLAQRNAAESLPLPASPLTGAP